MLSILVALGVAGFAQMQEPKRILDGDFYAVYGTAKGSIYLETSDHDGYSISHLSKLFVQTWKVALPMTEQICGVDSSGALIVASLKNKGFYQISDSQRNGHQSILLPDCRLTVRGDYYVTEAHNKKLLWWHEDDLIGVVLRPNGLIRYAISPSRAYLALLLSDNRGPIIRTIRTRNEELVSSDVRLRNVGEVNVLYPSEPLEFLDEDHIVMHLTVFSNGKAYVRVAIVSVLNGHVDLLPEIQTTSQAIQPQASHALGRNAVIADSSVTLAVLDSRHIVEINDGGLYEYEIR